MLGEWKFYPNTIDNIPSPYSENQDFAFSLLQNEWVDYVVPASLAMQGFDIKNNVNIITNIFPQNVCQI